MKVAVTGVAGNVGRGVARELTEQGHAVVGIDVREPEGVALATFHVADMMDAKALGAAFAGSDAVVHLAAISRPWLADADFLFRINTLGTFNALDAAASAGVGRFVMASSEAALGFTVLSPQMHPEYLPIDEDHPLRPRDSYGLSKLLGEEMCRSYARRGAISTICLRTCFVFSVDWRENSIGGLVDEERSRRALWSYVDVRDAAVAYRLACEARDLEHETLFVVAPDSGTTRPMPELLAMFHPNVPLRAPIGATDAIVSGARAKERLGFEPRYSWRDQIAPDELQTS